MMQRFWDVAPPMTWAILTASSILLLAGFVLLSHTLVRSKAHGDSYHGVTHSGRLEWTLRLGTGALLAGLALWAFELSAPLWLTAGLGILAAAAFGLQVAAASRHTAP